MVDRGSIIQKDMVPLIYVSHRPVARAKGSMNGSLPCVKGQMMVRRRLQFPNHGIFGSRVSSVSEHRDLSGGNLGRGRRSGQDIRGAWPSDGRLGYPSEVQGGGAARSHC